jgi:hypothetical protein
LTLTPGALSCHSCVTRALASVRNASGAGAANRAGRHHRLPIDLLFEHESFEHESFEHELFEHELFRKPVFTADQVRGRLFREALRRAFELLRPNSEQLRQRARWPHRLPLGGER